MDYSDWAPRDVRALISAGKLQGQTSGMCAGYAQANLCILPKAQAFDFLLFCMRNPRPCPILLSSFVGSLLFLFSPLFPAQAVAASVETKTLNKLFICFIYYLSFCFYLMQR